MCYSKQRVKDAARQQGASNHGHTMENQTDQTSKDSQVTPKNQKPNASDNTTNAPKTEGTAVANDASAGHNNTTAKSDQQTSNNSAAKIKQVHLHKHDSDELGMAILGGLEHGLPIMISEVFPDSSVGRSKKVTILQCISEANIICRYVFIMIQRM